MRTVGGPDDILVVGGGPIGLSAARMIAEQLPRDSTARVHIADANDPIAGVFTGLSMSCPCAAGQIILRSFERDTYPMHLGLRTLDALKKLADSGYIELHRRPWLLCAGNRGDELDNTVAATLEAGLRDGRLQGCVQMSGAQLEAIEGLRHGQIAFAVCDDDAWAVDPRAFIAGLARWATDHDRVVPHFKCNVTNYDGSGFAVEDDSGVFTIHSRAVVLCTGVHSKLFPDAIPDVTPVHLHLFDERNPLHAPMVTHSVAGETTIARYEGFGDARLAIQKHLHESARAFDLNALYTDVPGLRRVLDSHFVDEAEAKRQTKPVHDALFDHVGRYVEPECLPNPKRTSGTTASYARCAGTGDPIIKRLNIGIEAYYVQPSTGRGLNQCLGLGEDSAKKVLS